MNSFYNLPKLVQWIVATVMFTPLLIFMHTWMDNFTNFGLGLIVIIFLSPLFQFLCTPFLKLIKVYTYISPMLLYTGGRSQKYSLHNGTTFDYAFVMRGTKAGRPWEQKILSYYLEGLLEIIRKIEANEIPGSVEIKGTSYFFSESTANRLGFDIESAPIFEKLNIAFNYIDLTWLYSMSKGKLTFPRIGNVKTAVTTGERLLANKIDLVRTKEFISQRIQVNETLNKRH